MKKTLIALAAVAAVGAASAQVTLYGKIDSGLSMSSSSTGSVAGADQFKADNNNLSNSRWGMKGSENIGGGMAVSFALESKVVTGTGATGAALFDRNAQINLTGGFGTVSMGRMYTPYDNALGSADAQGYHNMAAINNLAGGIHGDAGRKDNAIAYTSPAMSGLALQLFAAPGADATTTVTASGYNSAWLSYSAGALGAHIGWESAVAAGGAQTNSSAVGINYNAGFASLSAITESATAATGAVDNGWTIGIALPVGAMSVNAGYARESTSNLAASNGSRNGYSLAGVYSLSKRTNLYVAYNSTSSTVESTSVESKTSKFAAGMRHDF